MYQLMVSTILTILMVLVVLIVVIAVMGVLWKIFARSMSDRLSRRGRWGALAVVLTVRGLIGAAGVAWFALLLGLGNLYGFWLLAGFAGFVSLMNAGVTWARLERAGESVVCAHCRTERPSEQTEANELCPRCENKWWDASADLWGRRDRGGDRFGVIPKGFRLRIARYALVTSPLLVVFLGSAVISGGVQFGALGGSLPKPVLLFLVRHADPVLAMHSAGEVLGRQSLSRDQADAVFSRVIALRNGRRDLPIPLRNALERDIPKKSFDPRLTDKFFRDAVEWRLDAVVTRAGVEPVLDAEILDATIYAKPRYALCVWVGEGGAVYEHPGVDTATAFANTYRDYGSSGGFFGPETERDRNAHISAPLSLAFQPNLLPALGTSGLAPGEHVLRVRIHAFVVTSEDGFGIGHDYFDKNGDVTPHPDAIWHETRDLTATFTIP